jgi:mannosyl-3-phosphoglycerate phosphatase
VVLEESGRQRLTGPPRAALIEVLREMQGLPLPVRGMSQMTVDEVCRRTGLTAAAAARAMQRSGSEPFVALGELGSRELELMRETSRAHGAATVRGGRFWHLLGAGVDKGTAVAALCDSWPGARPEATAAVGDAWNDLPMLELVDLGFLLGGVVEAAAVPARVQRIASPGPQGFAEVVRRLQRAWGLAAAEE